MRVRRVPVVPSMDRVSLSGSTTLPFPVASVVSGGVTSCWSEGNAASWVARSSPWKLCWGNGMHRWSLAAADRPLAGLRLALVEGGAIPRKERQYRCSMMGSGRRRMDHADDPARSNGPNRGPSRARHGSRRRRRQAEHVGVDHRPDDYEFDKGVSVTLHWRFPP